MKLNRLLRKRAIVNLADSPGVTVCQRSASQGELPACDCIYVNAGATDPPDIWLDALRPGGRLFPLTPDQGYGAMLLVTRTAEDQFAARFLTHALFIHRAGARESPQRRNSRAFHQQSIGGVRSLRRHIRPDRSGVVRRTRLVAFHHAGEVSGSRGLHPGRESAKDQALRVRDREDHSASPAALSSRRA